jgi:cell wall-associated NlpC family hydrolase
MIFSQHPAVSLNFQILVFNPLLFWLAWPKCKVRWRWEIILGCVLLFMVLGLVQSYAEGVMFFGMALGCLALSNMNLRKNASLFHLPSSIIILTSSVILLASCHSASKVSDDVYAVGKPAKHVKKHEGQHESGHADLYGSGGILAQAQALLGTRYRSGGNTPEGFDCSGFTNYVFGLNNINIGRSSRDQYAQNVPVNRRDMQPGDLVFFSGNRVGSDVGHVGIVTEVNKGGDTFSFIHSSNHGGVKISRSTDEYYARRYLGVRRVRVF